jgi:transposase-like protein
MVRCPWCSTIQKKAVALLGQLGRLTHYRCRYCGGQFSKKLGQ